MTHGRPRLSSIGVVGALGVAAAFTVSSCEPDHNPDRPGPPHIISAYVIDQDPMAPITAGTCDITDPRAWGGTFQMHDSMDPTKLINLRCVPDLLHQPPDPMVGDTGPFSFNVQIRIVLNELIQGDLIETQDNVLLTAKLKDGVVTASGPGGMPMVPINTQTLGDSGTTGLTSYFDPAGSDFKQGFYGSAPPGPSLVVTPGDGTNVIGLPSGITTTITLHSDVNGQPAIRDTVNTPLGKPDSIDITTKPFAVAATAPADGDMIDIATLAMSGILVNFSAPVPASQLTNANFQLFIPATSTTPLPAACYMVAPDPNSPVGANSSTGAVLTPTGAAGCPSSTNVNVPAKLVIKAAIQEQYGIQLMTDNTVNFTITPAGGADAGAP